MLTGHDVSAETVKQRLIDLRGLIFGGLFGTKPGKVYKLLLEELGGRYSVRMKHAMSARKTEALAGSSEFMIITCFWISINGAKLKAAAHTFSGRRIDDRNFEFYNETFSNKTICEIKDIFAVKRSADSYMRAFPYSVISVKRLLRSENEDKQAGKSNDAAPA